MIFRKIAFVLVVLLFSIIALNLFTDLVHTRKKIDKHGKNINTKTRTKVKTKSKKSYYR